VFGKQFDLLLPKYFFNMKYLTIAALVFFAACGGENQKAVETKKVEPLFKVKIHLISMISSRIY
jgi:hypothetical protein